MSVIVGYDGRPEGRDALALGCSLARATGEPLLVACVYRALETEFGHTGATLQGEAERTAAEAREDLPDDIEVREIAVPAGSVAHGLHDLAEREHPAALVVGSTHRGALGRVVAGSVASRLLSASGCSVAVAPRGLASGGPPSLGSIGVGFDDSPESWNAVQRAAALGVQSGGTLRILMALEPIPTPLVAPADGEQVTSELRVRREMAASRAAASVSKDLAATTSLTVGDPVRVLETEARDDLDLLVLGSRGYGPVRRVLLGSVSSELMRVAPCPMMIVPRSVEFDPTAGGMAARDEA